MYKSQYLHIGNPTHFPSDKEVIYLDDGHNRFILGGRKELHQLIHDIFNFYSHDFIKKNKENFLCQ